MERLDDVFQETEETYEQELERLAREEERTRQETARRRREKEESKKREIANYRAAQTREAQAKMKALNTIPVSIIIILLCIFAGAITGVFTGCAIGCGKYGENTALATGCGNVTPAMHQGQSDIEKSSSIIGMIFGGMIGFDIAGKRYEDAQK